MRQHPRVEASARTLCRAILLAALVAPALRAQELDARLWGVNGPVRSMARSGQTLYLAGDFSAIGPSTGGGVAIDRESAALDSRFPHVAGRVTAAVPDGRGGWFIGGHFTHVGGAPRTNLAHILASGQLADWAPAVVGEVGYVRDPDFEWRPAGVNTLLLNRHTLYVGGSFHTIAGSARSNLAAVDVLSGAVLPWNPEADGEVRCLGLRGDVLYVGGDFTHMLGRVRNGLAAVRAGTGKLRAWDPNPAIHVILEGTPSRVRSLATVGRLVYVGGDFDSIGGQLRNSVAALDARSGRATAWDARLAPKRFHIAKGNWSWPKVRAVAVSSGSVFIGGVFSDAGGVARPGLAALDARTGTAQPFDPQLTEGFVTSLAVAGRTLYAAGALYHIGGKIRPNLAALDMTTGRATRWNPRADAPVEMIAIAGRQLFVGGLFSSVHDWEPRTGFAAIDLTTGRATSWAPQANGRALMVDVAGNRVFAAGSFNQVNGLPRRNVVALDGTTGEVESWDPPALLPSGIVSSSVSSLLVRGDQLYVGGYFAGVGTPPGYAVKILDVNTAEVSTWSVPLDGPAYGIFPIGDRVYLGGVFGHADGSHRVGIAAVDGSSAALLPWAPELTGAGGPNISTMLASGEKLYMGGVFAAVNGIARSSAVTLDAASGTVLPWDPGVGDESSGRGATQVAALAMHDHDLWLGGSFTSAHGQPVPYLAVVDDQLGELTALRPGCDGPVEALLVSGDTMFVAGAFQRLVGRPQRGIGMFILGVLADRSGAARVVDKLGRLSLAPAVPNPVGAQAVLRFTLPASGIVDLAVYDIQGRLAAEPIAGQTLVAGPHEVALNTETWRPGFYFCRLSAGGESRVQKLLVVR